MTDTDDTVPTADAGSTDQILCPKCGKPVKSLRCGHCGSQLPSWQADLYGATIRQLAKMGGDRTDTGHQGGLPGHAMNDQPGGNGGAATPTWLFDRCNQLALDACRHPITLDVAAADWNHKCDRYFTEEQDGLKQGWNAKAAWCNPPHSATIIEGFICKAIAAAQQGTTVVLLVPWWNYPYMDLCEQHGRIHRISSPVTFECQDGTTLTMNNHFRTTPLVVVIFGPTIRPGFGAPITRKDSVPGTPAGAIQADAANTDPLDELELSLSDRAAILQTGTQSHEHGIVYTPPHVAQFLFDLLSPLGPRIVLDVASGNGALSRPWRDSTKVIEYELAFGGDFFKSPDSINTDLVLCNPPFGKEKEFLRRILMVVPQTTPVVLFATHRVRLGSYASSDDWTWCRDEWPPISSLISLPRGVFKGVNDTVEILVFRFPNLKPHYFMPNGRTGAEVALVKGGVG